MLQLSVVIPTYNRVDRLKRALSALERQSYPLDGFEVIIVSDGSTDGTIEYLESLQTPLHLQIYQQKNLGVAAARNHGFEMAHSELIFFLDDDVVPVPQCIAEHIQAQATYGPGCVVIGPMLTPQDVRLSPWVQWEQDALAKQYLAMNSGIWEPTARQFYTGNTSLARQHLVDCDGFDPSFRRAEDVELAYRLADKGIRFYFNPNAVGYHYAERTFDSWKKTPYQYGRNDVIFSLHKNQSWLLPTIFSEFYTRNFLIQILTRMSIDRPLIAGALLTSFRLAALSSQYLKSRRLANYACSAIFNMLYYQGLSDELGGKQKFLDDLNQGRANLELGGLTDS